MRHIRVRVYPSSGEESIKDLGDGKFEIFVREPAERGLANRKVMEIITSHVAKSGESVRMIKGHKTGSKVFELRKL